MPVPCPICRASRPQEQPTCRRCGAELVLPDRIASKARGLERQAVRALAAGEKNHALLCLQQAQTLHRSPLAMALVGFLERYGDNGG